MILYYAKPPYHAEEKLKIIFTADGMDGGLTAYWLGANDLHREGIFINPSGQPFAFTNWMDGEPNDSTGKEDCVAIDSPKVT